MTGLPLLTGAAEGDSPSTAPGAREPRGKRHKRWGGHRSRDRPRSLESAPRQLRKLGEKFPHLSISSEISTLHEGVVKTTRPHRGVVASPDVLLQRCLICSQRCTRGPQKGCFPAMSTVARGPRLSWFIGSGNLLRVFWGKVGLKMWVQGEVNISSVMWSICLIGSQEEKNKETENNGLRVARVWGGAGTAHSLREALSCPRWLAGPTVAEHSPAQQLLSSSFWKS